MARRLINLVTMLSRLLCAAACVLWVRSYKVTDSFLAPGYYIGSDHGDLIVSAVPLEVLEYATRNGHTPPRWEWASEPREPGADAGFEKFKATEGRFGFVIGPKAYWFLNVCAVVPWWAVATVLGLLPLGRVAGAGLRRAVSRSRVRRCRCAACSYDLTGNISGVCPECGTSR